MGKNKKNTPNTGPVIKLDSGQPIEENVNSVDPANYVGINDSKNKTTTTEPVSRENGFVNFLNKPNTFTPDNADNPIQDKAIQDISNVQNNSLDSGIKNQNLSNAFSAISTPITPEENANDGIDSKALQNIVTGNFNNTDIDIQKQTAAGLNSAVNDSGQGIQKIAELTDQALNNPNVGSEISTKDINNAVVDLTDAYNYGDPDYDRKLAQLAAIVNQPQNYAEPAVERLGLSDYFPDIQSPIRVGGYSGSIVGNNDIYVGQGALFPHGILDARQRALEGAAAKKAKLKDKLFEMATVQGAYPYQKQLDNEIMDYNNKYGELVNYNWDKLAPGTSKLAMEYWDGVKKRQTLGRATKEIHAKAEQLFKDMTSEGKLHVSPEQQRLMSDWYMGKFKMDEILSDPKKERDFYDLAKKMKAYDNVSFYSQEASKILKASADKLPLKIKEGLDLNDPKIAKAYSDLYAAKQTNDYDMYTKALMTFVDDDRVNIAAKAMLDQHRFALPGSEDQKLDYVKKNIMSYLGKQLDIDDKIQGVYNRERLAMQRQEHDWKKQDRITPYQNIYNNYNDEGNKTITSQTFARGDFKKGYEQLEKQLGGKIIPQYISMEGKKTVDKDAPVTIDFGFNPTKNDEYKTSIKNTYNSANIADVLRSTGRQDLIYDYNKNGDIEVIAKPTAKQGRFAVRNKDGQLAYITQNYMESNPNWRNDATLVSVDPIQVYALKPKVDNYGKTTYEQIPLKSTRDVTILDQNGISEKDSKLKNQYRMLNTAMQQGDLTHVVEEGPDAKTVPDFNP